MNSSRLHLTRRTFLAATAGAAISGCTLLAGKHSPETWTQQGRVQGFTNQGVQLFLGMPYGGSTAGAQRFLPPTSPPAWTGVRYATRLGARAPQAVAPMDYNSQFAAYFTGGRGTELQDRSDGKISEDCLFLNVLTPNADGAGRPVLFYIHGGGFTQGSGDVMTLSERLVMEEDVVVVTVNHRLGPLGFMYLGDLSPDYAAGNPGMLDLVAALQWVRDNIAEFGGDPNKVTLFGESGGGAKIALLSAMPQAAGLFRGAIIQSGILPSPAPANGDSARALLARLRIEDNELAKLQAVPLERLMSAMTPADGILPVADGTTLTADIWNQAPETGANVPMVVGYCADEMTLFALGDFMGGEMQWDAISSKLARRFRQTPTAITPMVEAYRDVLPNASAADVYSRMLSDALFGRDMVKLADRKAAQQPPVYFYRMENTFSLMPQLRSFHTIELPLAGRMVLEPSAESLSRQLGAAWAAFARSGNPNHAGLPHWQPRPTGGTDLMLFNESASVFGNDPQAAPREAWIKLVGDIPIIPDAAAPLD